LREYEIEAEAGASLGGIEPSFIVVGCMKCTISAAAAACNDKGEYHICTNNELHTGGY
jgi:hypothetical protein